ncbi:hypothetical protein [Paenibacillus mendelii]|uniref:Uncharacterized protein n=1 Tax=Paenibacillus mendelii TaxID=206163 RepID=A0ABV6J8Q9_9BACL|nr:hypothetical protein [Paenibacillus mendelii]MCQ6559623.1 hypothetical protein [Paenibacillus mendelii]
MDDQIICPWCQTEIVWDEEIGPERYCPHCENELSGYRTMQIGIDSDDEDQEDPEDEPEDDEDETSEWESGNRYNDAGSSFLTRSREHLALEETVERILDQQGEVPECPSCREYMLEVGLETVADSNFRSTEPAGLNTSLLAAPFQIVRYVCPSCFTVMGKLAKADQERFVQLLTKAADEGL